MIIAGGLYRETCEVPHWNAVFGSGGRAAAALAELSPGTELHTYVAPTAERAASEFEKLGVRVVRYPSKTGIAFSYFHPLSRPHIEPTIRAIPRETALRIQGSAVVRFGLLEGDAVVKASRAVHDPQTSVNPPRFRANGSQTDELAIVLNEDELRAMGQSSNILEAANNVIASEGAEFVVAKGGVRGATLFYADGKVAPIPPYKTECVFKIGTGDIFTSVLAHYWAEARRPPSEAAELASRAVAAYAQSRELPISADAGANFDPVTVRQPGRLLLLGSVQNIEDRWLMEEARWCVRELGVPVVCPSLDGETAVPNFSAALVLVNKDFARGDLDRFVTTSTPTVIFAQDGGVPDLSRKAGNTTNDFVSAIYEACWQAMLAEESP